MIESMKTVVHCAGCERPILDRFIFNVLDLAWHAKCVKCADCKCHLSEKCFSREGKLYCRQDFFRRYGTKCSGCAQGISPNDLVRRAKNKVFHLKCFTCMVCRKQLSTGEELYVLDENKFICKDDYINTRPNSVSLNSPEDHGAGDLSDGEGSEPGSVIHSGPVTGDSDGGGGLQLGGPLGDGYIPGGPPGGVGMVGGGMTDKDSSIDDGDSNHSGGGGNGGSGPGSGGHDSRDNAATPDDNTVGGGGKRRGPRTTIKAKQLETLKAAFAATPKPTRHIREQLAQETGLNMRVIQVWFQNRRSKERRMKQLSTMGARRNFYRNPRRMRALRPGMSPDPSCTGLDDPDLPPHHPAAATPFGYFTDGGPQGDMYGGSQSFYDFFPGQQPLTAGPGGGPPHHPAAADPITGFPPAHLPPQTSIEQPVPPGGPLAPGSLSMSQNDGGHFISHEMMIGQQKNSSPDTILNSVTSGHVGSDNGATYTSAHSGSNQPSRSISSSVDSFASPPSLTHPQETPVW